MMSLILSNSRMQKMPDFDSVGRRNAMPSSLSRQNLVWAIVSLFRSSRVSFDSAGVRRRFISLSLDVFHIEFFVRFSHWMSSLNSSSSSCQIVSRFFSPEIHMNLQLGETIRASSPWINRQDLW